MPSDPWDASELARTAELYVGAGTDSGVPATIRFLSSSARLLRKKLLRWDAAEDSNSLALFVLRPGPPDPSLGLTFTRLPMLDQASEPVTGRLTLTNEGLNVGHAITHSMSDNELFDWVIDDLHLGQFPTVVFDPRVDGGEIRFYEAGLAELTAVRVFSVAAIHAVSIDDVKNVIDMVHSESLITPQQQIGRDSTWAKPSAYWVSNNSEAVIQSQIRIALKLRFPLLEIEHEGAVRSGRFDLCIGFFEPTTSQWRWFGVLELKVLKTKGSTGRPYSNSENAAGVTKGLGQAFSYRENRHADWGSLCCFDMRNFDDDSDTCFDHVRDEALTNEIDLSRWRLYNTSEALQVIPTS